MKLHKAPRFRALRAIWLLFFYCLVTWSRACVVLDLVALRSASAPSSTSLRTSRLHASRGRLGARARNSLAASVLPPYCSATWSCACVVLDLVSLRSASAPSFTSLRSSRLHVPRGRLGTRAHSSLAAFVDLGLYFLRLLASLIFLPLPRVCLPVPSPRRCRRPCAA